MKPFPTNESQPEVAPLIERAPRAMTLLMTGKLLAGREEGLCRVRNLSATGMMIETRMTLQIGQDVRVELRCTHDLAGRIVWTREGAAGIAFGLSIDVEAVLAAQAPTSRIVRSRMPRAPRLAAACAITIDAQGDTHEGILLDISQGGAKLRLPFQPARDERLLLTIPDLPLKSGAVRWVRDGEVGLAFYEALPFDMLAEWLDGRS